MITTALLVLSIVVWLPLLFYQLTNRAFAVLLVWLFIAPVASNFINRPHQNPFFQSPDEYHRRFVERVTMHDYFTQESEIEVKHWFEPTRLLFACFVIVFILNSLSGQKRLGPFDHTEVRMLLFVLILLASALWKSINLFYSLRVVLDGFIVPFLAYFISRRLVTSEARFIRLNQMFIYMGLYLIILGLVEWIVHAETTYKLLGPFREKHAIAITTILPFFVVLADTLYTSSIYAGKAMVCRSIRWFVLLLAPFITGITLTRGNWLGFLLGLGAFVAMGGRFMNMSLKLIAAGLMLILLPTIPIFILALTPEEIITGRMVGADSVYGRIATWTVLLQEGLKSPILGIGLNNSRNVLYNTELEIQGIQRYKSAHNSYLAFFVEQGVVGLLTYLAIVTCIMRMGFRLYNRGGSRSRERWWGVVVVAVMIAYLTPAMFGGKLHTPNALLGAYVFALLGGLAGVYGQPRDGARMSYMRVVSLGQRDKQQEQGVRRQTPVLRAQPLRRTSRH